MKKAGITTIMLMAFVSLTTMSCQGGNKENLADATHSEMDASEMNASNATNDSKAHNSVTEQILADYMTLKNALVATDEKAAANAGKKLKNSLNDFKLGSYTSEEQKKLKEIMESAVEHAEHINRSDIAHQREHFQMLTADITDMVEITGTNNTLYQQFCPMYANDKGGAWLSMEKEIRNPYFGSKMMKCGEVQKEIK
jgi:hypothetical protein